MKKFLMLGLAAAMMFTLNSCKSSKESQYKMAYDQAKQQELAQGSVQATDAVEIAPVSTTTGTAVPVDQSYREEKVVLAVGEQGSLKAFSVVCGSYSSKTNAELVRNNLISEGYAALVVQNPSTGLYRVVCASYDDRQKAAEARAQFKANHPGDADFQKAWLLYNK